MKVSHGKANARFEIDKKETCHPLLCINANSLSCHAIFSQKIRKSLNKFEEIGKSNFLSMTYGGEVGDLFARVCVDEIEGERL